MNLLHHLQEHHPDAYSEIVPSSSKVSKPKQKQPTLQQVINKGKKYNTKSTHAYELNKAVAYYLAKDVQPLYVVERPGFKKLVAKLDPKYDYCNIAIIAVLACTIIAYVKKISPNPNTHIHTYIHHIYIFNSCNTGTSGLPDMYTRGLRVYISGRPRVPVLQLLCTTSLAS